MGLIEKGEEEEGEDLSVGLRVGAGPEGPLFFCNGKCVLAMIPWGDSHGSDG